MVVLNVIFTERYPKEPPKLSVRPVTNISTALCETLQQKLLQEVTVCTTCLLCFFIFLAEFVLCLKLSQAEENLDMVMILTLAQSAKVRRCTVLFISPAGAVFLCLKPW